RARGEPHERAPAPGPLAAPWRHSYALNFVAASVEVLAQRVTRPAIDFRFDVLQGGAWLAMNRGGADLDEVRLARALAAGEVAVSAWDAPLARLAALAEARGFAVVVAYLPSAHAAYAPGVRFSDPEVGAAVTALDGTQRTLLPELVGRHGMTYVD